MHDCCIKVTVQIMKCVLTAILVANIYCYEAVTAMQSRKQMTVLYTSNYIIMCTSKTLP